MMKKRLRSENYRNIRRRGSVLIEFAASIIALIFILLGIMEFGWLVKNNLAVQNAAREGVRIASLGRTVADINTRINNSLKTGGIKNVSISLTWSSNDGADLNASTQRYPNTVGDDNTKTPPQNNVPPGKLIQVEVKAENKTLTGFPFIGKNIVSRVTMVRENPQ
jgi:Flp pilus assembly protein TadG